MPGPPGKRVHFLASPRKQNQKKATPSTAPFGGSLRCSPVRAAAQLALRAQTVLADCPRPVCAARRWIKGITCKNHHLPTLLLKRRADPLYRHRSTLPHQFESHPGKSVAISARNMHYRYARFDLVRSLFDCARAHQQPSESSACGFRHRPATRSGGIFMRLTFTKAILRG